MAVVAALSGDAFSKSLKLVKRLRRLQGTALINNGVLMDADIPDAIDSTGEQFARECISFFDLLADHGCLAQRTLLSFDGVNVLLLCRGAVILALFYADVEASELAEASGIQFLEQFEGPLGIDDQRPVRMTSSLRSSDTIPDVVVESQDPPPTAPPEAPTPDVEPPSSVTPFPGIQVDAGRQWEEFRYGVEVLFTKVLGSAQATRIINRELNNMGLREGASLLKAQFRPFGMKLTQRIKDRSIRRQLETELIDLIQQD